MTRWLIAETCEYMVDLEHGPPTDGVEPPVRWIGGTGRSIEEAEAKCGPASTPSGATFGEGFLASRRAL